MLEVGREPARSFDRGIDQAGAVPAKGLEEGARLTAVLRASALVAGIKRSVAPVWSEVRSVPECHHPEHARLDAHLACRPVTLEQM